MNRRQVLAVESKTARATQRASLGKLSNLVVSASTQNRYRDACQRFFAWAKDAERTIPNSFHIFDELVSEYICTLWEDGEGRSLAANLVSGLQHFCPQVKHNVPMSWRLLGAWQRNELPCRAPPLTLELVYALAGQALRKGRGDIALLLVVGFDLLLRTGELLRLVARDVTIDTTSVSAVVSLGSTKSGKRQGAMESVTVSNPLVVKLLAAFVANNHVDAPFLRTSQANFRSEFKLLCDSLDLSEWNFKPYSLRRGGATHHFRQTGQLSATIIRGRWGSAKTARVYLNDGLAALASFKFNNQTSAKIRLATKTFHETCGLSQERGAWK